MKQLLFLTEGKNYTIYHRGEIKVGDPAKDKQ
jgi:hypothetical protein